MFVFLDDEGKRMSIVQPRAGRVSLFTSGMVRTCAQKCRRFRARKQQIRYPGSSVQTCMRAYLHWGSQAVRAPCRDGLCPIGWSPA